MSEAKPLALVVDDEVQIRRFLRAGLELDGFAVEEAESGTEALRCATLQPPDLVADAPAGLHPTRSARVMAAGTSVGVLGEVDPDVLAAHDIDGPVAWFEVDLGALDVGDNEHGHPLTLGVLGKHVFVAGASGSGKGSLLWSPLRAIGPMTERLPQASSAG